jgi:dTDP-glucose 4,6-dehydratase
MRFRQRFQRHSLPHRVELGRALPNSVYQGPTGQPITVYGGGLQTRSFCYVSDLIEGLYRLMNSDEHEPVNVGNPRNHDS